MPEEENLEASTENRHRIEGVDVTCWDRLFQYGQQQHGRNDRRRWSAVYSGYSDNCNCNQNSTK